MVNRCGLCKESEEFTDHNLIHWARTKVLWAFLLSIFCKKRVFPVTVRNLLLEWKFKGLDKKSGHVWQMTPLCWFRCIWKTQNRKIFNGEKLADQQLKESFIKSLYCYK